LPCILNKYETCQNNMTAFDPSPSNHKRWIYWGLWHPRVKRSGYVCMTDKGIDNRAR
jgi:hypothetical protein